MRVLLVEDHIALREMISGHLVRRGFAVDAVERGAQALAAVATAFYDAVILDLGLPDMDGMQVLAALRTHTGRTLPALIVTARDGVENRVRGLSAGADDYIVKPFELIELEARLRAVLRRPGTRDDVMYRCGRLNFDVVARQGNVGDAAIDLTRREASLLEELLRASGRVVVKDVLEERLSAFGDEFSSNALEALVSRLRRKLAGSRAGVAIETKRGIGYRLVASEDPS